MIDDRTDITPDAALAALAAPLSPIRVVPWGDAHGTLRLDGLLKHEIVVLHRGDASWKGNMTRVEIDALAAHSACGRGWPGYPCFDEVAPTVLAFPDGMPGVWGRGATYQEAAEAVAQRLLELLRDLPALFDALAEGSNLFGAVAGELRASDMIAQAKFLAFIFHDHGYDFEEAASIARAAAALAKIEDRSDPPPGYGVFEWENDDDDSLWVFQLATEPPPDGYRGRRSSDRSKVVAWAWEHFDDRRALAERERVKPGG